MKILFATLILTFALFSYSMAESDSLVIKFKDNHVEKIDISNVSRIQFENITGVEEQTVPASTFTVKGNYPNPIHSQTSIEFEIGTTGDVVILIFDYSGNQIKTLKCENCQPGKNTMLWNCLDNNNNPAQSGSYFYEVHFGNEVIARKMIVIN